MLRVKRFEKSGTVIVELRILNINFLVVISQRQRG